MASVRTYFLPLAKQKKSRRGKRCGRRRRRQRLGLYTEKENKRVRLHFYDLSTKSIEICTHIKERRILTDRVYSPNVPNTSSRHITVIQEHKDRQTTNAASAPGVSETSEIYCLPCSDIDSGTSMADCSADSYFESDIFINSSHSSGIVSESESYTRTNTKCQKWIGDFPNDRPDVDITKSSYDYYDHEFCENFFNFSRQEFQTLYDEMHADSLRQLTIKELMERVQLLRWQLSRLENELEKKCSPSLSERNELNFS